MKPDAWKWFASLAGLVAGCGALATIMVTGARYVQLPQRVEAAEEVNRTQEKVLDRLTTVVEQQQRLMEFYVTPDGVGRTLREQDGEGIWWCCPGGDRHQCWNDNLWKRCGP